MYSNPDAAFQVRSAGIDGTGEAFLFQYSTSPDHGPTAIAIDPGNAILYWNQYQNTSGHNDIWRSALGTFSAVKWEHTLTNPYTYIICLDTINRNIYFAANTYWDISTVFGSGNAGNLYSGPLDTANAYSSGPAGTGLANPSVALRGIAVDGTGGHMYYVSNNGTNLSIVKADLSLANPNDWVISTGFEIKKLALDLKGRKIYWTTNNSIYRADLDTQNSNIEQFLPLADTPTGIAIAP